MSAIGNPVRLTRRGRVVFTLLLFLLATAVVVLVAAPGRAADLSTDPPPGPPVTVVRPGDTLWTIAERHAPGQDRRVTVHEIRRLNGLDSYRIRVGQRLILPGSR